MSEEKKEESLVEYRLTQIEQKIDQVLQLQLQQQALDFRMNAVEATIKDLKANQKTKLDRWLNPLVSAVVSGVIAFIFIKVGLK
ncbi:MAG: hypothetical protein K5640_07050 [Treponema sp.]|nr:hypothetical protein [Treponema sp.]